MNFWFLVECIYTRNKQAGVKPFFPYPIPKHKEEEAKEEDDERRRTQKAKEGGRGGGRGVEEKEEEEKQPRSLFQRTEGNICRRFQPMY